MFSNLPQSPILKYTHLSVLIIVFTCVSLHVCRIFSTIVSAWLTGFQAAETLVPQLVTATNKVYVTIMAELLPTPAKSHYTFNLRDLSKVFQGMLMAIPSKFKVLVQCGVCVHSLDPTRLPLCTVILVCVYFKASVWICSRK